MRRLFPPLLCATVLVAVLGAQVASATSGPSMYWGAYINGAPADTTLIDRFEAETGKKMSVEMFGEPWQMGGSYMAFPAQYVQTIRNRGTLPVVDWASWNLGLGNNQPNFSLAAISSGAHDAYLMQWAQAARAWGHPFFIRMDAEMNGWWSPWSEQVNGNHPGDFVRAWRHVHDVFTQQGATNVSWVWCPNIVGPRSTPMSGLYPGDSYVDWTCMDGYNWGTDFGNTGYWSFTQVFQGSSYNGGFNTYQQLLTVAPTKPIIVGETASSEHGGSKSAWITSLLGNELPNLFPAVKGLLWFNWNNNDPSLSWPIESSFSSQSAFAAGIASPYYATNTFGAASTSPIPPPSITTTAAPAPPPPAPAPSTTSSASLIAADIADSYVDATLPNSTSDGTATSLRSDNSPINISVLKFDLSGLAGKTLDSVTLRIHTTNASDAGSGGTHNVYLVPDVNWLEQYLSYNNDVAISTTLLGSFVPPNLNTTYDVRLTPWLLQANAGGRLTIAIRTASGDAVVFYAREAGPALAPQLLVSYH